MSDLILALILLGITRQPVPESLFPGDNYPGHEEHRICSAHFLDLSAQGPAQHNHPLRLRAVVSPELYARLFPRRCVNKYLLQIDVQRLVRS